jgi:dihydroxyacetone kinase DhaKLM complex PTS-EIIA-like component DhaM
VTDRGESWGVRFDAILKQLADEDIVELNAQGSDDDGYAAANARIVSEAVSLASTQDRYALAAMVWNGLARSSTDMTDSFRQLAAKEKLEIITVPTL